MFNAKEILRQDVQKTNLETQARAILNMTAEDLDKLIVGERIDVGDEKSLAGKKEIVVKAKMGDEAYVEIYKPMRSEDARKNFQRNVEES